MSGTRGGMGFDFGFPGSGSGSGRPINPERALRVVIVGDFGAGDGRVLRPVVVEPAEIDRAIQEVGVSVETSWEGQTLSLRIRDADGFHPDSIVRELPWMKPLIALRGRLKDPASSAAAVQEARVLGLPVAHPSSAVSAPAGQPPAEPEGLAGLLGKGVGSGGKGQAGAGGVDINAFIRKVVGETAVGSGSQENGSAEAIRAVDARLSAMMRGVLRDPRFGRIEAAWHAMRHLAANAWDEEAVRYELCSLSESAVDGVLASGRESLESLLRGSVGDADGPADVVLLVEPIRADEASMARAATVAAAVAKVGGTLILSGDAALVGSSGFGQDPDPARWQGTRSQRWSETWREIVASNASARMAIVMPRWLARRPYGLWSEPVERFTFEEVDVSERGEQAGHGVMCWAGGGWLLLRVIVEAWASDGAEMQLGSPCIVGDLPHAAWKDQAGSHAIPCSECYLVERAVEAIGEAGFVAAASMKGRDAVVLGPIQNIAGGSLLGRWA
jgi:type VI secretion system protein ImpC